MRINLHLSEKWDSREKSPEQEEKVFKFSARSVNCNIQLAAINHEQSVEQTDDSGS